jgi:hypothetical protein
MLGWRLLGPGATAPRKGSTSGGPSLSDAVVLMADEKEWRALSLLDAVVLMADEKAWHRERRP